LPQGLKPYYFGEFFGTTEQLVEKGNFEPLAVKNIPQRLKPIVDREDLRHG
jgi:hypothetical protein